MKIELQRQDPKESIVQARINLLRHQPFFGQLVLGLELREANLNTYAIVTYNGILYYDSKLIKNLSIRQVEWLLAHNALHCALNHHIRSRGKNPIVFDIAADLVVNTILASNGFHLPPNAIRGTMFGINCENKPVEEVYEELMNEFNNCPVLKTINQLISSIEDPNDDIERVQQQIEKLNELKESDQPCNKLDCPFNRYGTCGLPHQLEIHARMSDDDDDDEIEKAQRDWTRRLINAMETARQQGDEPYGIERIYDEIISPPREPWNVILRNYIKRLLPSDYTYNSPHKRSFSSNIYFPNIIRHGSKIAIVIDTSGSIHNDEIALFMNEIKYIFKSMPNIEMYIIDCDADVYQTVRIRNTRDITSFRPRGGGGTDFRPAIETAEKIKPDIIIYFTDGYGTFPSSEPRATTIWVMTTSEINPPFGKLIQINKNGVR